MHACAVKAQVKMPTFKFRKAVDICRQIVMWTEAAFPADMSGRKCKAWPGDMSPHAGALIEWKSSVRSRVIGQQSERPVNNDSPCQLARKGRREGRRGEERVRRQPKVCV